MMYEVIERITLTVEAGSRVYLSEQQATLAAAYLIELPPTSPDKEKTDKSLSDKSGSGTKK